MMKLILLLTLLFSSLANAKVWQAKNRWDNTNIARYEEWMKSKNLEKDFFMKEGPWKGLKLDCADAAYALRIIFSFENSLPFKIKSGASNDMTKFDRTSQGVQRVRAFIDYVSDITTAQDLALNDTYPVKVLDIRPGDIYLTSWLMSGHEVRHTYLIKEVSPFGYFKFLFATTPAENRIMNEILGMPYTSILGAPWGFKRFRLPEEYGKKLKNESSEQYEILAKVGTEHFLEEIGKILEKEVEGTGTRIERQMKNLCDLFSTRLTIVNEAIEYVKSKNNRCLSKDEFSLYTTASRDPRIFEGTKMLVRDWERLSIEGGGHDASFMHQLAMDYLSGVDKSAYAKEQLVKLCTIKFPDNTFFDLKNFFDNYKKGLVSSHPNDSFSARWGVEGTRTTCQNYY